MKKAILLGLATLASCALVTLAVWAQAPNVPVPAQGAPGQPNLTAPVAAPTSADPEPVASPTAPRWTEDGLPPVMYLWRDTYGGTFHKLPGYWSDGQGGEHVECWIVTGDTALVMCPDGTTSTS